MRLLFCLIFPPILLVLAACSTGAGDPGDAGKDGGDLDAEAFDGGDAGPADGDDDLPTSCGFDYDSTFTRSRRAPLPVPEAPQAHPSKDGVDRIAHAEPEPPGYYRLAIGGFRYPLDDLVLPDYSDDMPLFARGAAWDEPTRCFETPLGVQLLGEARAYDLYRAIAELTTGVPVDDGPDVRSVLGLRGAYPGTFAWHGNQPDRFNDTLVLLWIDAAGDKHVREFPVNTDTGAYDFGYHSSSSLRPNRRYRYINGWHRGYNALSITEYGYRVRDDANKNGHWDSDRNGWLPPDTDADHDREGSAHNIHMGSLQAPLGAAEVRRWSAGCQVIPGMLNWLEFIANAWTGEGDPVDYFLVDVRDIAPEVWDPCTPDGGHRCPFPIDSFPFSDQRDTAASQIDVFDLYSCSAADESGPELVYLFTIDRSGTLSVSVDCQEPVDIDVHLLDGDDPNACLARANVSFEYPITPGRYFIVADTYTDGAEVLSGEYLLQVDLQ